MIRLQPVEDAVPREWRRVVRDYPGLSMVAAIAVGLYLGRNHRKLVTALVGVALTAGIERAKKAAGLK